MAEDIKIFWDVDLGEGDIKYDNGDLVREKGLETSILMSLFTDRRADEDDVLPDPTSTDRRGWYGDLLTDNVGDRIGSKLWLLERSKTDQDTINKAEDYINECLEWLITDGVAIKYDVEIERQDRVDGSATLALKIRIYQSDGSIVETKFNDLWKAQFE